MEDLIKMFPQFQQTQFWKLISMNYSKLIKISIKDWHLNLVEISSHIIHQWRKDIVNKIEIMALNSLEDPKDSKIDKVNIIYPREVLKPTVQFVYALKLLLQISMNKKT